MISLDQENIQCIHTAPKLLAFLFQKKKKKVAEKLTPGSLLRQTVEEMETRKIISHNGGWGVGGLEAGKPTIG